MREVAARPPQIAEGAEMTSVRVIVWIAGNAVA